jgi:2-aminoadipate transaminase
VSPTFRFSELTSKMQPSPIRELFTMIQRPGMISFAGGLPDPDVFPVEPFAACADVLRRDGRQVLQYGASEGYQPLREVLLAVSADRLGYEPRPDELLITSGSQQAVDLMARALLDCAIAEGVAFVPGAAFFPAAEEQVGEIRTGDRFARLCFTFADAAAIDEGCRRLGRAMATS